MPCLFTFVVCGRVRDMHEKMRSSNVRERPYTSMVTYNSYCIVFGIQIIFFSKFNIEEKNCSKEKEM